MDQAKAYSEEISRYRAQYDDGRYKGYEQAYRLTEHRVFSEDYRPKDVLTEVTPQGEKRTTSVEVNRIGLPIEQDIVSIHTSFCVGIDPVLGAEPESAEEQTMLALIQATDRRNKMRNRNREVVRSLLSEAMVAEYWFTVQDEPFYRKHKGITASKRLKMAVWSPFRGDRLVPIKDSTGDLVRFLRFYDIREGNKTIHKAMDIDEAKVRILEMREGWTITKEFAHGFDKIPVVYMERHEPLCHKIKHIRERLEDLTSNFADSIDYNAAPKLVAKGQLSGLAKRGKSQVVEITGNNASLEYLTWNQSADAVRLEMETLIDLAYQMTCTPRISLKDMQGAGNDFSGESFRYVFMGTHLEVRNHEEIIGEYLQRRYNFMLSALALLVPSLQEARYMEIEPRLVPYIIERDEPETKEAQ